MTSHSESIIAAIHNLSRLHPDQLIALNKYIAGLIDRLLKHRKRFIYVVVSIPLDKDGHLTGIMAIQHEFYDARKAEAAYRAGQKQFVTMNTSDQLMIDTVIDLEM